MAAQGTQRYARQQWSYTARHLSLENSRLTSMGTLRPRVPQQQTQQLQAENRTRDGLDRNHSTRSGSGWLTAMGMLGTMTSHPPSRGAASSALERAPPAEATPEGLLQGATEAGTERGGCSELWHRISPPQGAGSAPRRWTASHTEQHAAARVAPVPAMHRQFASGRRLRHGFRSGIRLGLNAAALDHSLHRQSPSTASEPNGQANEVVPAHGRRSS